MNDHNSMDAGAGESSSNIFLNLAETDSTGIPSLKQAPESAIASSAPDSRFNTHLLVALGVVAVGAGVIYAMRYIGMRAGLDEKIVSIDYTSQANTADFARRFGSVMEQLDESTIAVQLADHDSFVESPFSRPGAMSQPEVRPDPGMSEAERLALQKQRDEELARQRRHDLVVADAMHLHLQGIVGGAMPAARISGQAVRAGMKLGEFFTVEQITGRSVIIEGDGMRFELALGRDTVRLD